MDEEKRQSFIGKKVRVNKNEQDHVEFIGKEGVIIDAEQKFETTLLKVRFKETLSMKGFRSQNMTMGELYFDLDEKTIDFI